MSMIVKTPGSQMDWIGRILTQFTGLLRTNTVAAKRDLLADQFQ